MNKHWASNADRFSLWWVNLGRLSATLAGKCLYQNNKKLCWGSLLHFRGALLLSSAVCVRVWHTPFCCRFSIPCWRTRWHLLPWRILTISWMNGDDVPVVVADRWRVLCTTIHHVSTASPYQFNRKRSVCIFDGTENHTFRISKYPCIPWYLDTAQAYCIIKLQKY